MTAEIIVDQFAGPGGWDEALRMLGLSAVGYEKDAAACATARAAGHQRMQVDLTTVSLPLIDMILAGLISSPPCQAWSRAGKRKGILDQPRIFRLLTVIREYAKTDPATAFDRAMADDAEVPWHDPGSKLVLEPVRWVLAQRPRWVACEQVPDVLPFWQLFALLLQDLGYSTWTGLLSSERYGVPQTRVRAILVASLDRKASAPPATHHAYNAREIIADQLFEVDLLDWVSMAEALGWTGNPTVKLQRGEGMIERHGDRLGRTADQPAPTIRAGSKGSGPNLVVTGERWVYRNGNRANAAERPADEPAPTVMFSARGNDVRWLMQSNQTSDTAAKEKASRSVDAPSLTLTTNTRLYNWVTERPATTIMATGLGKNQGLLQGPGADFAAQKQTSVRVTVEEAAILQSVRPGYPWHGSRTKQYEQVGNMIPPLLAVAVLGNLLGLEWQHINRAAYRSGRAA